MAWTTLKTVKVFQMFGIPKVTTYQPIAHAGLRSLWGPFGESYDIATTRTDLTNRITAAVTDTDVTTQMEAVLTRWDAIGPTSPLRIDQSSDGAQGVIADHPGERENCRREIANLIGFDAPKGGFMARRPNMGGGMSR